ncbi:MAG: ABC transporter permease [Erysipelothrix sp.]|nr:ABC transporter permease [Erysipelothrix sp.]
MNDKFVISDLRHPDEQEMLLGTPQSFMSDAFSRFKKNKGALVGLWVIGIIIVLAIVGPMISGTTFDHVEKAHLNLPPRIPFLEKLGIFNGSLGGYNIYQEKGLSDVFYWFGTDKLGRDLWTRVWKGTQISFLIAFVAVGIDVFVGITYGLISGYFGGKVDAVMQRFVEILSGIPNLVVVTLFMIIFEPGILTIILALMLTGWIGMSRVVRSQVLKLKDQEFVLAARTLGGSHADIIKKELLPNIMGQIIVMTMFSIPNAIFYESFLAFVGLGLRPPFASLGVLISTGYLSMLTHPFIIASPVIVLSLLMLSFNLIADGLRDAFDPKMKGF